MHTLNPGLALVSDMENHRFGDNSQVSQGPEGGFKAAALRIVTGLEAMAMTIGIFIGEEELNSVMAKHRRGLERYSEEELSRGVTAIHSMGDPSCCDYFVRPASVLYEFLRREGKQDVYMIFADK